MRQYHDWDYQDKVEEALDTLYGDKPRDLTAEGYAEAIHDLRKQDPGAANRFERILDPLLTERIFPRRQRPWHETSYGVKVRLALLSGNPHVEADVREARRALQLPQQPVHATENDDLWKYFEPFVRPERLRQVVEASLAGAWPQAHREAARGGDVDWENLDILSPEMRKSATTSAAVDLGDKGAPKWLRWTYQRVDDSVDSPVPMEWVAKRLLERHQLPRRITGSMIKFVLTEDVSWISNLDPLSVGIRYGGDLQTNPADLTVSVFGVDEFLTKKDWDHVWNTYVVPQQEFLFAQRGMSPQGRKTKDTARLARILPLYRQMMTKGLSIKDALGIPMDDLNLDDIEPKTIQRTLNDLKALLSPR